MEGTGNSFVEITNFRYSLSLLIRKFCGQGNPMSLSPENPFSHDKLMQWKPEVTFHFFTSHLRDFKAAILTHFQQNSHKKLKKLHFTKVQNKLISFVFIFYAFKVKHKTRENSNSRNRIRIAGARLLISRSSILKFVASIIWSHPYYLWDICQLLPANPIIHKDKSNPVAVVGGPLNNTETVQKLAEHTMSLQCSQIWRLSYSFNQPSLQLPKSLLC